MRTASGRRLHLWTWGASVALHVGLIAGFGWFAFRSIDHPNPPSSPGPIAALGDRTIAVELPGVAMGTLEEERPPDPKGDPPRYFGGAAQAQLDDARHGRSGAPTTVERPTNLSDRDERLHLTPDLLNRLDIDQQQRIKSSTERATREDRRGSKEPMELSFLASGKGDRAERRTPTDADPSRGARMSESPSVQGSTLGAANQTPGELEARADPGSRQEGSLASAPGLGVHDGRAGFVHRVAAHVMRARPDVVLAAVSVPATRNGRPRDNIESDQEVATTLRSIVHASTAAGLAGQGSGGVAGGGDPGAGGSVGVGSTGRPIGPAIAPGGTSTRTTPVSSPIFGGFTRSSTRSGRTPSPSAPRSISARGRSSSRSRSRRMAKRTSSGRRRARAGSRSSIATATTRSGRRLPSTHSPPRSAPSFTSGCRSTPRTRS